MPYNTLAILGAQSRQYATDLHWLAFVLTGSHEIAVDIAVEAIMEIDAPSPFFSNWMRAWARRIVIAKALGAIRADLIASARQTEWMEQESRAVPPRSWVLDPAAGKRDLEQALLSLDLFPRAVLLITTFEGMPLADAALLLDTDLSLIRKAQVIALRSLPIALAVREAGKGRPLQAGTAEPRWQRA